MFCYSLGICFPQATKVFCITTIVFFNNARLSSERKKQFPLRIYLFTQHTNRNHCVPHTRGLKLFI